MAGFIGTAAQLRPLQICVVGCGRMGQIRASAIYGNPRTEISSIVDVNVESGRKLADRFKAPLFETLDEALQNSDCDAVWICTNTHTHAAAMRTAIAADKCIAVEKPVCDTPEDIKEIYDMAASKNIPLHACFHRRLEPSHVKLREAVLNGAVGKIHQIRAVFRDHPRPSLEFLKTGGDPFHDMGVHDIDFTRYLMGEDPVEVFAKGCSFDPALAEIGVMDTASAMLTYPSGVVLSLELSRGSCSGFDQRYEVFGDKGTLNIQNIPRTAVLVSDDVGIRHDLHRVSFAERYQEAFLLEVDHFVDVCGGRATSVVDAESARMATVVAEAARQSALTGAVVKLV